MSEILPQKRDIGSVAQADDAWQEQHQKTEGTDHPQNCIQGVWDHSVGAGWWWHN